MTTSKKSANEARIQQCCIATRTREGLAQAQRGEFVSEERIATFFAHFAESDVGVLLIEKCEKRSAAIDRGEMLLVSADEVMLKYRQ